MIVNCATLGLDFERASLSDYLEALQFQNEVHGGEKPGRGAATPEDQERLARVIAART